MTTFERQFDDGIVALPVAAASRYRLLDELALVLLSGLLVLTALTFGSYGITWDEEIQHEYGVKLLNFYVSGFHDRAAFDWFNLYLYGGSFDLAAALVQKLSPFGIYETRHLLGGLVGVLGLAGTWRLGRLLGGPRVGPRVGLTALVLLALIPAYYGHMFFNCKDVPFACGVVWSLHLACRLLDDLPRPRIGLVLGFGVVFGLTIGTRVGGVLVGVHLGLVLLAWLVAAVRDGRPILKTLGRLARALLPALPVAYGVMALCWPWAVQDPLNPIRALTTFADFPWNNVVLFEGAVRKAVDLPATYLPVMLAVQLPELMLAGLALALGYGIWWLFRGERPLPRPTALRVMLLLLAAGFPVAFVLATRPILYNGFRHFLFILPPAVVLVALACDRVWQRLIAPSALRMRVAGIALGAAIVVQVWIMAVLHPNEYVYYNRLVGGIAGAEGRFELDYWGNSLAEATAGLVDYIDGDAAERRDGDAAAGRPARTWKVFVCGYYKSVTYFLPPGFVNVRDPKQADFFISWTQSGCDRTIHGREVVRVERFGAALSVVKDLRRFDAAGMVASAPAATTCEGGGVGGPGGVMSRAAP